MGLKHIPIAAVTDTGHTTVYKAECQQHQWAVQDGNHKAVEALVRGHVGDHPAVHCPSPPAPGPLPQGRERFSRYRIVHVVRQDGTSDYTGSCGVCSAGWDVFNSPAPIDAVMHQHWVTAHADDFPEETRG